MKSLVISAVLAIACTGSALANSDPKPSPSPIPDPPLASAPAAGSPLTYSAFLRGYYFTRTNASGYGLPQSTNVLNQATFNDALHVHAGYTFSNHWRIGGTYVYGNPLDNCDTAEDQVQKGGPCSGKTSGTNPDNTLPAFTLSTLYEAYVQYGDSRLGATVGNQLLTTPWANGADTRLKPEAYQGADFTYKFNTHWAGEAAIIDRFESRVDSDFVESTLLTATNMADAPGPGANLLVPKYSSIATAGFGYARAAYSNARIAANAYFYNFMDIATVEWFDAKLKLNDPIHNSFFAIQAGNEQNGGRSVIGKIDSQAVGIQGGITPVRNLDFTLGYDYIPEKSATYAALPAGVTCAAVPSQPPSKTPAGNQISVKGQVPFMYFLPTGGTPNCVTNADGSTTVYYGGWASPYTDSYTSDPLYTTSMTGGMVERRSPGSSAKAAATWWTYSHRIRLIASFAMYNYGNDATGITPSRETDLDGTFYFRPVPATGAYHGLVLRHRYGDRDMTYTQFYGGLPVFKYNRTQLEYDF
ncbi:MAG TPA: hypothetical protein VKT72_02390 [Candidatus Baltobacteraceae bacterium]|nr:hypothetical protein [Candidatus Baltobacteraceae bacterium]